MSAKRSMLLLQTKRLVLQKFAYYQKEPDYAFLLIEWPMVKSVKLNTSQKKVVRILERTCC